MQTQNTDHGLVQVIATRLEMLHGDMQEIKGVQKEMASAFSKLILIEERQANTSNAQDRAFKLLETLEARVGTLEKAAPLNAQTSQWVIAAVYGAAGLAVMFIAKNVGLI